MSTTGRRRTTRIGVNLLWLVPGVVGGSEEYTVRLLDAFADRAADHPDLDVTLYAHPALPAAHPDLVARYRHRVAPAVTDRAGRAGRVVAESTWLAWAARQDGVDLVHHGGGTMPLVRTAPGVVTVHDLQPWAMPENFSLLKRAYLRATVPGSVRRAHRVVTLSNWVRTDVAHRLGVPTERIELVPPGIAPDRAVPDAAATARAVARVGVEGRPFFVYPAITYAHKNHRTLLWALARLVATHPRAAVVLTGGAGPQEEELAGMTAELGLADHVRRPGRIPADELDALYRQAVALTFPSRYEGFGLPVLEAMRRGCPVIASRAGALGEVVGDGGVLVGADDIGGWAAAMARMLDDPGHRAAWADRAARRAHAFTWDGSAARLEAVYRSALVAPEATRR